MPEIAIKLQPNWTAWLVDGVWKYGLDTAPAGATRERSDYDLYPGRKYRLAWFHVVAGRPMALPNGTPAIIYGPWLDATSFGGVIFDQSTGQSHVNQQTNIPTGDAARKFWFEELQ